MKETIQESLSLLESFRKRYPFVFDPFQEEAIGEVLKGNSVIVSAPTGAGKTLIAEFAIFRALAYNQRLAYTTPLKALSNQKYADFLRQYGGEIVGILTGDVKVNPGASILVMTTEILRNMLYTRNLEDIAYVVLDECHFLGDEGRGTVWEEIIINCPKEVQIVALSATVGNIEEISRWISETHGPITAIHHPYRPVPLEFLFYDLDGRISPAKGFLKRDPWRSFSRPRLRRKTPDPRMVIERLQAQGLLPAIYFIFSRNGCESALNRFLEDGGSLLERDRRVEVEEAVLRLLSDYPGLAAGSGQNKMVFEALRRGIGVHHAGVLPALKRFTEILFERGLVKVVFATETMSLGIHMPAKSVILQGLRKRSEYGFRHLTVNELTQMAGRAGRRGIDKEGKCLIVLDSMETMEEALRLIKGNPEPIESQFRIGYSSAALLLLNYSDPGEIRRNIEKSFGQFQNRKRIEVLEGEIPELEGRLERAHAFRPPCRGIEELIAYRGKREEMEALRPSLGRRRKGRREKVEETPDEGPGQELSRTEVRAHLAALGLELSCMVCHRCSERPRCEKELKKRKRLEVSLETKRQNLEYLQNSCWVQFQRVVDVLRHFAYMEDSHLSQEGRFIANLRHDNELLVARVVFSGVLEGLKPEEVAALLSCLVEEPREEDTFYARAFMKRYSHMRQRVRALQGLADKVHQVQRLYRVVLPVVVHTGFLAATYRWASGEEDWVRLVQGFYGGHEGDLIRAFRRLIDLCRQLIENPGLPPGLEETLSRAIKALDRDIVLESALI